MDHESTQRENEAEKVKEGAAREDAGKHSAMLRALPCSRCQGIPQSASLPCLRDRMIDLLYLQMNS